MGHKQKINKYCECCKGTGKVNESGAGGGTTEQACPLCNGVKIVEWGYIEKET